MDYIGNVRKRLEFYRDIGRISAVRRFVARPVMVLG